MAEVFEPQDPSVERLSRLTGDRCKAKNAGMRRQTLSEKIDEAALAADAEVFKAMSILRWGCHRDDETGGAYGGRRKDPE